MKGKFLHYLRLTGIALALTLIITVALLAVGSMKKWEASDELILAFYGTSLLCLVSAWAIFLGSRKRTGYELPYKELTANPNSNQKSKEVLTTGITVFIEKPKHSLLNEKLDQITADIRQGYDASFILLITGILLWVIPKIMGD